MAKSIKDFESEFFQAFGKLWRKSPRRAKALFGYKVHNAVVAKDVAIDLVGPIVDDPEAPVAAKRAVIRGYIERAKTHALLDDGDYQSILSVIRGKWGDVEGDATSGGRRRPQMDPQARAFCAMAREAAATLADGWGVDADLM